MTSFLGEHSAQFLHQTLFSQLRSVYGVCEEGGAAFFLNKTKCNICYIGNYYWWYFGFRLTQITKMYIVSDFLTKCSTCRSILLNQSAKHPWKGTTNRWGALGMKYYEKFPKLCKLEKCTLMSYKPTMMQFQISNKGNITTSSPSHMDQSHSWVQSHNHLWFQRDLRHQTPPGWCRGLACKHERQCIQLHAVETNTHIGNNPVTSATGTMVVSHQGKPTHYALF